MSFLRQSAGSLFPLLVAASVLMAGCGGQPEVPRAAVTGTVTVDGTPLPKGKIIFTPAEGNASLIATAQVVEGRFETREAFGPILGMQRVEIISTDDGGYAPDDEAAMERWVAEGRKPIKVVRIPPQYQKDGTLKAEVKTDGPNEFEFELVSNEK